MLKIEHLEVVGWEAAIRGMRNPMNSWSKSDSGYGKVVRTDAIIDDEEIHQELSYEFLIGENDYELMTSLRKAGTDHRKYMRMITVYMDITAPLYWWKEFDTYKVGTVANSCSTMHKIASKPFSIDDFSHEHLFDTNNTPSGTTASIMVLTNVVKALNDYRYAYLAEKDPYRKKDIWWQLIQLLPSSYNQKRTVMLNYEVLTNIYKSRRNHKLDEWRAFCEAIEEMPYGGLITRQFEKGE